MKLPIKFRWKDIHNETVYDILRAEFGGLCLSSTKAYHGEMNEKTFSQLVGYDKNGKEIYSDDKIRVYGNSVKKTRSKKSFDFNVANITQNGNNNMVIGSIGNFPNAETENQIMLAGDFFKVNDIGKTFDNVELVEESEKNDN